MDRGLAELPAKQKKLAELRKEVEGQRASGSARSALMSSDGRLTSTRVHSASPCFSAVREQNSAALKLAHDRSEVLRLWKLHTSECQQNDLSGEEPNGPELLAQNETFKKVSTEYRTR